MLIFNNVLSVSNEGKVSHSRKQREPLIVIELTPDILRRVRLELCGCYNSYFYYLHMCMCVWEQVIRRFDTTSCSIQVSDTLSFKAVSKSTEPLSLASSHPHSSITCSIARTVRRFKIS